MYKCLINEWLGLVEIHKQNVKLLDKSLAMEEYAKEMFSLLVDH